MKINFSCYCQKKFQYVRTTDNLILWGSITSRHNTYRGLLQFALKLIAGNYLFSVICFNKKITFTTYYKTGIVKQLITLS
jgi:hypothetical protein